MNATVHSMDRHSPGARLFCTTGCDVTGWRGKPAVFAARVPKYITSTISQHATPSSKKYNNLPAQIMPTIFPPSMYSLTRVCASVD